MEYKEVFEKEIISRTLGLLQEYSGPYEKTLLLNCCIGLLITPKEFLWDKLPETPINKKEWGICPSEIKMNGEKTVKQVVRHIRNAISHNDVKYSSENGKDITHIRIISKDRNVETFKIDNLKVESFETFVKQFANWALENI